MTEQRPFASLSAGLLARKGQARPAMRPQGFGTRTSGSDDLGWNDMGALAPVAPPVEPIPVAAPAADPAAQRAPDRPIVPLSRAGDGDKAAFTLRLNGDRHLKLRLACALNNRSAQQIVTDALDTFLDKLPELDTLAGAIPGETWRAGAKKTKKG